MVDGLRNIHVHPVGVGRAGQESAKAARAQGAGPAFSQLLEQQLRQPVKLSAHAEARLRSSRIELTKEDMARLEGAIDKVAAKGGRESLVLLGDLALVVSVKNRTVITAVAPDRLKENVFTNIDSAVIA